MSLASPFDEVAFLSNSIVLRKVRWKSKKEMDVTPASIPNVQYVIRMPKYAINALPIVVPSPLPKSINFYTPGTIAPNTDIIPMPKVQALSIPFKDARSPGGAAAAQK